MSPAHSLATQMAFDKIVEQPTESSPTWDCKQARTRPPPGLTPAHKDWISVLQSRSLVNNPNESCAHAPQEPPSSKLAPNAIANNGFVMVLSFWSPPYPTPRQISPAQPKGRSRLTPQRVALMNSRWTIVAERRLRVSIGR